MLYQINARSWLRALGAEAGYPMTLREIPDEEIDRLAGWGFDWVYLLGIWETGALGKQIAAGIPELWEAYRRVLPDVTEDDVCGSCFAITGYQVNPQLGSAADLRVFRQRLNERGLRLMLDFIPNHTARDHPWVNQHPEFYIQGDEKDLAQQPQNYGRNPGDARVFAYGRDPNFPGWSDTFQLNYANPGLQAAMRAELLRVAGMCDGVRCDMAMLVLPEVFERTWGVRPAPFWPEAIAEVRSKISGEARNLHPEFVFLAEVYWNLEATLLQQGFDYAYDKDLYDRLRGREAPPVRDHFQAPLNDQRRLARFLENHDEARAAETFPEGVHQCAALLTYLSPGLRFFHEGQFEGHRLRMPVQLCRRPTEPRDETIHAFYERLLSLLRRPVLRKGDWQLLACSPAGGGDSTWENFVAFAWSDPTDGLLLVIVNYSPQRSQCQVAVPLNEDRSTPMRLTALMSAGNLEGLFDQLSDHTLVVDLPAWGYLVLEMSGGD